MVHPRQSATQCIQGANAGAGPNSGIQAATEDTCLEDVKSGQVDTSPGVRQNQFSNK